MNDTYGHSVGDTVLQLVASIARAQVRREDVFARIGGEEFGALIPAVDFDAAVGVLERIRAQVGGSFVPDGGRHVGVTLSIGVAGLRCSDDSFASVLSRADAQLYAAKRAGRDRVHATR